ncbi:MAG: hypothetical protein WCL61_00580 [bacterium]
MIGGWQCQHHAEFSPFGLLSVSEYSWSSASASANSSLSLSVLPLLNMFKNTFLINKAKVVKATIIIAPIIQRATFIRLSSFA